MSSAITELAHSKDIDIIILCEYEMDDDVMLRQLNSDTPKYTISANITCDKVKIFSNLNVDNLEMVSETSRWTIRKVESTDKPAFLLVAAHLVSKMNWSSESQFGEAIIFRDAINKAQTESGVKHVIIIGDLNMNPYEEGLVSTVALHATSDKKIALKQQRTVQGNKFEYFYNPMWNFLGDESVGDVPGTFLYKGAEHMRIDWNIFDQILISPSMIASVPNKDIEIIIKSTSFSFLKNNGEIDAINYSDHLPIMVSLQLDLIKGRTEI